MNLNTIILTSLEIVLNISAFLCIIIVTNIPVFLGIIRLSDSSLEWTQSPSAWLTQLPL